MYSLIKKQEFFFFPEEITAKGGLDSDISWPSYLWIKKKKKL